MLSNFNLKNTIRNVPNLGLRAISSGVFFYLATLKSKSSLKR